MRALYDKAVEPAKGEAEITVTRNAALHEEGYCLHVSGGRAQITAGGESGALYGVFALLRRAQMAGCAWDELEGEESTAPSNPLRMLNHWDNMEGDIERGYSGQSFFFHDNEVLVNERTVDYARLVASVGINGVVLNNVNVKGAATWLISPRYYAPLRQIQEILASYGIRMFLCINFARPNGAGRTGQRRPLR